MKLKSLMIYCIFSAIILCILLWQHAIELAGFRFYLIAAIIIGYVYYSETLAQKRRMAHWESIRSKGKLRFVLVDYVLFRGGSISILLILVLSFTIPITVLIICSFAPVLGIMAYAGSETWSRCEQLYSQAKMNSVAEKIKLLQN